MRPLLLLLLGVLAACGSTAVNSTDLSGQWLLELDNGDADLTLQELPGAALGGTLDHNGFVWSLTGQTVARPAFSLVLLPARNEAQLFDLIGLEVESDATAATKLQPQHAADRIVFRGTVAADGRTASGLVSSAFATNTTAFKMRR